MMPLPSNLAIRLLERPEATSALTQLGVDVFAVKEYSKFLGLLDVIRALSPGESWVHW